MYAKKSCSKRYILIFHCRVSAKTQNICKWYKVEAFFESAGFYEGILSQARLVFDVFLLFFFCFYKFRSSMLTEEIKKREILCFFRVVC